MSYIKIGLSVSWLTISVVIKFINQSNSKSVIENKTQSLTREKKKKKNTGQQDLN